MTKANAPVPLLPLVLALSMLAGCGGSQQPESSHARAVERKEPQSHLRRHRDLNASRLPET